MNEENTNEVENVELNKEEKSRKDEFEAILEKIKKMSEAIELHTEVKDAVSKQEIDNSYLKYVENSLEDRLFCDAKFDAIRSKVLLEVVCPELTKIEDFKIEKLVIDDIGSHFEEQENYIDKICIYENKFVCLFGICENNPEKVIKYEQRKFTRTDMIEAIQARYEDGQKIELKQYDEYYIGIEDERLKVFSERKITALVKMEETAFDKIKSKLASLFTKNIFAKKTFLPNIELIYDTNPNRLKDFKHASKFDAKLRMKALLNKEREITRA